MAARAKRPSPILGAAHALIGAASDALVSADSVFSHSFEVEIARVRPDPDQPRRAIDPDALASLAATLEAEGQLQPILLRPDDAAPGEGRWILVAGERRWRAAQLNGWTRMLAIVHRGDADVAALLENLQRVDLAPLEEARGIERLLSVRGWTQERAARALGKATSDLSGTLRILHLPADILAAMSASASPPSKNVLIELARIEDPAALARLAALARTGELTIRAIRAARAPRPASSRPADPAADEVLGRESDRRTVGRAVAAVARLGTGALDHADIRLLLRLRAALDAALPPE
jgi:ParB family chromosome partitioning protein